jgi:hypothetical protein
VGKRTPHWIERVSPLPTWAKRYAHWLAKHPDAELTRPPGMGYRRRRPSNVERVAELSRILGRRIHPEWIRFLEKRADFVAYFERLQTNPRFLARELSLQKIAGSILARCAALEEAQRLGDVKAIELHTRWVVELAFRPKRTRRPRIPPVVIQIGRPALAPLDAAGMEKYDVESEPADGRGQV